jgi:nucleotide-binding universal stress UspA family protein
MAREHRVLVCYDGSEGSRHALAAAATLFPGAQATVTFVWSPPLPYGGVTWGGQFILPPEIQREIEAKAGEEADRVAADGVRAARAAGLEPVADAREATGPVWRALLTAAAEADADVIVAGSHGYGEVKALLLGSTAQALGHHARLPLLLVPAPGEK